jgi:DNA-binding NarL/FixJ family response regulator
MSRIILVDDHALIRAGLREFLSGYPEHEVVGEASTAREAFPLIEAARPDFILMDLDLPGIDGVVATREILRRVPEVRVLIVSAHAGTRDVMDAFAAGAAGYVLKSQQPTDLIEAMQTIVGGEQYLSAQLARNLATGATPDGEPSADVLAVLSEREREIFRLASDCRGAAQIAHDLCIARKTVDSHLNRINRKLRLRNLAELVRLAATVGIVHAVRDAAGIRATRQRYRAAKGREHR